MKKSRVKSLYIHIPFCHDICGYCDFPKIRYFPQLAKQYLSSLKKELDSLEIKEPLETIYIGGGTPTALSDEEFLFLLQMVEPYSKNIKEYTIEANPESLSLNKIKMMKEYGVNRVSLGVQSLDDNILKILNRHHTFLDVNNAINNLKKEGIDNISCDLILGLPHSSKEILKHDLEALTKLNITHISCYSLTIHPNTIFYLNNYKELEDDQIRDLYDIVKEILEEKGFIQYEVSNFAKENKRSLHNLTYWNDEEYYGVGLGAASYVDGKRNKNTLNMNKYINGEYLDESLEISKEEDIKYFLMLNLRKVEGFSLDNFKARFGFDIREKKKKEIEELVKNNLLRMNQNRLFPSYQGLMTLDNVLMSLFW